MSGKLWLAAVVSLTAWSPGTSEAQQCLPAPENMAAWWSLDETSGSSVGDSIGSNDGTHVSGPVVTGGKVAGALDFDGFDDGVQVQDSTSFDMASFTIDAWIKTTNAGNGRRRIVSQQNPSPNAFWVFSLFNNVLEVCSSVDFECVRAPSAVALNDGVFHHVAVVRDAGTAMHWYIDGALVKTQPISSTAGYQIAANVFLGRIDPIVAVFFSAGTEAFAGVIDELEIFQRALSSGEVQAIFGAGSLGKCKDEDGDGFLPPQDCDEGDPTVNPDGLELPGNFVDEDCNGDLGDCDPCFAWRNHGEYVRCVAHGVEALVIAGALSEEEGDLLVSSAARSEIGKKGFVPAECL